MSKMKRHAFTPTILATLTRLFGDDADAIFEASPLLGYLNTKTKSATSGSKARGAFANHYAIYVLIEDYLEKHFGPGSEQSYTDYEGARFTDLLRRQRELPFGSKLQNHALNGRLNDEFRKYYPELGLLPVIRDVSAQRYWIHEDLLTVSFLGASGTKMEVNLAEAVLEIIDSYVSSKRAAFSKFIETCVEVGALSGLDMSQAAKFITRQLEPSVDARIFEIVSFAILKVKYGAEAVWIGSTAESVTEQALNLYKTGRTNANDGGIDFVMKPLGRFFQVTETIDVGKYFLDIDKVQRFHISFVIKTESSKDIILNLIKEQATTRYKVESVIESYMGAIEEIITVPDLLIAFTEIEKSSGLDQVLAEIVLQAKLEFNYVDEEIIAAEVALG